MPHRIIRSWYTGRGWVNCYIRYGEEGPERAAAPPSPLLVVPNVTAHPSTASVTTSYCIVTDDLCPLKGSTNTDEAQTKEILGLYTQVAGAAG